MLKTNEIIYENIIQRAVILSNNKLAGFEMNQIMVGVPRNQVRVQ